MDTTYCFDGLCRQFFDWFWSNSMADDGRGIPEQDSWNSSVFCDGSKLGIYIYCDQNIHGHAGKQALVIFERNNELSFLI